MTPGAEESCLRRSPGKGATRMRLLCFPHAGGGASSFNRWREALPEWVELIKVQLPGREDRKARCPHRALDAIVRELLPEVAALCDLPLAIYGHSMGALVGFETARALRRNGLPVPAALFVSGRRAPHRPLRGPMLHLLSEQDLADQLRAMGAATAVLENPKWRAHYLPTMRADLEVSDVYSHRHEPPLDIPLLAFVGHDDQMMARVDWEAWSEQAAVEFQRFVLPGGHFLPRASQDLLLAIVVQRMTQALAARGLIAAEGGCSLATETRAQVDAVEVTL